jgi:uncharacterized membrane protein
LFRVKVGGFGVVVIIGELLPTCFSIILLIIIIIIIIIIVLALLGFFARGRAQSATSAKRKKAAPIPFWSRLSALRRCR